MSGSRSPPVSGTARGLRGEVTLDRLEPVLRVALGDEHEAGAPAVQVGGDRGLGEKGVSGDGASGDARTWVPPMLPAKAGGGPGKRVGIDLDHDVTDAGDAWPLVHTVDPATYPSRRRRYPRVSPTGVQLAARQTVPWKRSGSTNVSRSSGG